MLSTIGVVYRSSWELLFHYRFPSYEYESLRIKYFWKDSDHVYIVDFVDHTLKSVVEVKPNNLLKDPKTIAKLTALEKWCKDNSYSLLIASEKVIKELRDTTDLSVFDKNVQRKLSKIYETSKS